MYATGKNEYLYRRARQAGLEKELKMILRRMNLK